MIKNLILKLQLPALLIVSSISMIHQPETETKKTTQKIEQSLDTIDTIKTQKNITKEESLIKVLNNKGYTNTEIEVIYENLSQEQIGYLISRNYINITEYLKYPYFDFSKLDRYVTYQKTNNIEIKDTIIKVNIGLDNDFYTNTVTIENPDNLLVLVNKYNQLPSDYIPNNLTQLKCNSKYQLQQEAAVSFDCLVDAAKTENVNIYPYSAYRSYEYQNKIYNRYVKKDGQELADTYSARPGYSEHQTGLSIDIRSIGYNRIKESDYEWMKQNAHHYGYIIRYPENSTNITGYQEEPWHLRYVGVEAATEIKQLGITLDEYHQIKLLSNNLNNEKENQFQKTKQKEDI